MEEEIFAICKICRKKITDLDESGKSIVRKYGPDDGKIGHFDCAYEDIHGHPFMTAEEHEGIKCKFITK